MDHADYILARLVMPYLNTVTIARVAPVSKFCNQESKRNAFLGRLRSIHSFNTQARTVIKNWNKTFQQYRDLRGLNYHQQADVITQTRDAYELLDDVPCLDDVPELIESLEGLNSTIPIYYQVIGEGRRLMHEIDCAAEGLEYLLEGRDFCRYEGDDW